MTADEGGAEDKAKILTPQLRVRVSVETSARHPINAAGRFIRAPGIFISVDFQGRKPTIATISPAWLQEISASTPPALLLRRGSCDSHCAVRHAVMASLTAALADDHLIACFQTYLTTSTSVSLRSPMITSRCVSPLRNSAARITIAAHRFAKRGEG